MERVRDEGVCVERKTRVRGGKKHEDGRGRRIDKEMQLKKNKRPRVVRNRNHRERRNVRNWQKISWRSIKNKRATGREV